MTDDALTQKRLADLEDKTEGFDDKLDRILNDLGEIKADTRSTRESQDRHGERIEGLEARVSDVEKQIYRWALPVGILVAVVVAGGIAAMTGVDLSAIF